MKIGIFTNNYLPNPYGVSASIESFRKEFEALGHQVFIFAPKWKEYHDENPNACPPSATPSGVGRRVFRYPSIDIEIKFRFPLPIPYSRQMDKIIKNLDLDIIHSQHPNLLGSAAMKWAKKKNIPLVFTWHTLYDQYTHFFPFLPKKMAVSYIIKKAVKYANKCDQVVVPSQSALEIVQKWGVANPNITAIPSGVEEKLYQNHDRNLIRGKYGIKDEDILLLLISRLTEEKNINFVFDSAVDVLKNNPQAKFLVAGDGYLLLGLKESAKKHNLENRIFFAGVIDKDKIKNYYAAGDIFVYASKSETQGMIISEAMYAGLPIVAVNATGICDLVENNVNGFLVSEDNPSEIPQCGTPLGRSISRGKEFTEAVNKLIIDEELRKKMGVESARIAREKYTAKICAQKMLEIYKEAINKGCHPE